MPGRRPALEYAYLFKATRICVIMEYMYNVFHPVVYTSFVVFCLISKVIAPFLCSRHVRVYSKLNVTKKVFFQHRCAGLVHGFVVVTLSIIVCLFIQDGSVNDYIHLKSKLGIFTLQISFGYYSADLIMVFIERNTSTHLLYSIHHVFALLALSLCMLHDGKWLVISLLTFTHEIIQPFLFLHLVLKESKTPKSSQLFFILASGIIVSYLYRGVSIVWCWYAMFRNIIAETDPTFADISTPLYGKIYTLSLQLLYTCMDMNWTYKALVEYMPYITKKIVVKGT